MIDESDEEIEEPAGPELYSFKSEERGVVAILVDAVRRILKRPDLEPFAVHMCGVAIHALQRLPLVTAGVGFSLNLVYRYENGNMDGLEMRIDSDEIDLGNFGSVYTEGAGSDSYSGSVLRVAVGGREANADYEGIEEWAATFRQCADGHDVSFEDFGDSAPDWFNNTDAEPYWDQLESDFA
jgi:hypothetical protein